MLINIIVYHPDIQDEPDSFMKPGIHCCSMSWRMIKPSAGSAHTEATLCLASSRMTAVDMWRRCLPHSADGTNIAPVYHGQRALGLPLEPSNARRARPRPYSPASARPQSRNRGPRLAILVVMARRDQVATASSVVKCPPARRGRPLVLSSPDGALLRVRRRRGG